MDHRAHVPLAAASITSSRSSGPAPRSLAHSVAWTLAGTGIYSASQWLIIVVLAHAGSTRGVGQYAMGLATTAPIVLLAGLQLRDVQATDVRHQHSFADYLGLRLAALLLASVGIVVAAALGTPDREGFWTVVLLGAAKIFESLSDVHYGLLQQHERMDRIAQSLLLRGVGGLAAVATGQLVTGSAAGAAGALALCWAAVAISFDRRSIRRLHFASAVQARPRFSMAHLAPLVRLSAPLGVVLMLVSLQTNVPRYFVQRGLGTEQLGVFAALSSLFVAGNLVVNAVGQSTSPRLARAFVANDLARFKRLLGWMLAGAVALGLAGTALAISFGQPLLALLFGPAYAVRSDTFVLLMSPGYLRLLWVCLRLCHDRDSPLLGAAPTLRGGGCHRGGRGRRARPPPRPPRRGPRVGSRFGRTMPGRCGHHHGCPPAAPPRPRQLGRTSDRNRGPRAMTMSALLRR